MAMDTAAMSQLIADAVSRAVKAASTGSAGDASQNAKKPDASGNETRQLTWQQKRAIERQTKTATEAAMNVVNRELEPLKKDIAEVRAQVMKITAYLQENKKKKELKRQARKSGDQSNGSGSSSPKKTKTDDAETEPHKTQSDDSDAE